LYEAGLSNKLATQEALRNISLQAKWFKLIYKHNIFK
jgi:hypothetical protein